MKREINTNLEYSLKFYFKKILKKYIIKDNLLFYLQTNLIKGEKGLLVIFDKRFLILLFLVEI